MKSLTKVAPFNRYLFPIDKQTRIVASGGNKYTPIRRIDNQLWNAPPVTIKPPRNIEDITGQVRGSMTIIGYLYRILSGGYGKHLWLVRCECGTYESRVGKVWRKGLRENKPERGCFHCNNHRVILNREYHKRTGKHKD